MKTQFTDSVTAYDVRTHADGYKIVRGRIARTGLQGYLRHELGDAAPMGDPNDVMQVYRPDDEVFSNASLNGWAHVPVTLDHPSELVTPDNVAQYAAGEVTSRARLDRDAGWLELEWVVKDAAAIAALDSTHKQVSGGYTADIDFTSGVTPDGRKYDGVQRGITPNHLALVPRGRAFSDAETIPHKWGISPVILKDKDKPMDMKPIAIGDAVVNVALADADIIVKMVADHKVAIETKDTMIGELKAENAATAAKVLTDAQVEALVADRVAVSAKASTLVDGFDATGKTVPQIKREAVASVYGADAAAIEVSDAEINGIFRVMAPAKVDDTAREVLKSQDKSKVADGAIGWAAIQKKGAK